ncbi:unnamed protein product [Caretta caretta]
MLSGKKGESIILLTAEKEGTPGCQKYSWNCRVGIRDHIHCCSKCQLLTTHQVERRSFFISEKQLKIFSRTKGLNAEKLLILDMSSPALKQNLPEYIPCGTAMPEKKWTETRLGARKP